MATPVTGLVIEKMRKMVSSASGSPLARSFLPITLVWTVLPCRATSVTTPASVPSSTSPCR